MPEKYKRVLLKLSGEALAGSEKHGINLEVVEKICNSIKDAVDLGVEVAIVVGGGNFWRGRSGGGMDRTRSDHMGMLATAINSLALSDFLESLGVDVRVQTAIPMHTVAEPYIRNRAVRHLDKGRVVIFGCGTGNPFFSTDTAAALRAAEVDAQAILMAKTIDAVYDKDPNLYNDAVRYSSITFTEVLSKGLAVMDMAAASLCRENNIPVLVFSLDDPNNIVRAIMGENTGTIVTND